MKTTDKVVETIMNALDNETEDLSIFDYLEVLIRLGFRIREKSDAAQNDLQKDVM